MTFRIFYGELLESSGSASTIPRKVLDIKVHTLFYCGLGGSGLLNTLEHKSSKIFFIMVS